MFTYVEVQWPWVSVFYSGLSSLLWVQALDLVGDIVLCSWARHYSHNASLHPEMYKWGPANLMLGLTLQ